MKKVTEMMKILDHPQNTSVIWDSEDATKMCTLVSGNVCLKYTFTYNNDSKYIIFIVI